MSATHSTVVVFGTITQRTNTFILHTNFINSTFIAIVARTALIIGSAGNTLAIETRKVLTRYIGFDTIDVELTLAQEPTAHTQALAVATIVVGARTTVVAPRTAHQRRAGATHATTPVTRALSHTRRRAVRGTTRLA